MVHQHDVPTRDTDTGHRAAVGRGPDGGEAQRKRQRIRHAPLDLQERLPVAAIDHAPHGREPDRVPVVRVRVHGEAAPRAEQLFEDQHIPHSQAQPRLG